MRVKLNSDTSSTLPWPGESLQSLPYDGLL